MTNQCPNPNALPDDRNLVLRHWSFGLPSSLEIRHSSFSPRSFSLLRFERREEIAGNDVAITAKRLPRHREMARTTPGFLRGLNKITTAGDERGWRRLRLIHGDASRPRVPLAWQSARSTRYADLISGIVIWTEPKVRIRRGRNPESVF